MSIYTNNHLCRLDSRLTSSLLHASTVELKEPVSGVAQGILRMLSYMRLTKLTFDPRSGAIIKATNLTLPNVILITLGPMKEQQVTNVAILAQILGSCFAFGIRYGLVGFFYDGDRR